MTELTNITGNGPQTMSSREIAELVEKRHRDVTRDIRVMLEALELDARSFAHTYLDSQNREQEEFLLPRDLTMTLVTGYSIPLRKKVIDRLDELEQRQADPSRVLNDPAALRGLLGNYAERVETLEAQVQADAPKVAFHDAFAEKDGLYTLQNAGRIITGRPNKFIQELKKAHLFYQGGALVPYVRYRQQGLFEVKVEPKGDYVQTQTYITPKGLQYFAEKLAGQAAPAGAGVVSALTDYLAGAH